MEDTIEINGITYVRKTKPTGNYCIVRCRNAGVHAGYVELRENGIVKLRDSRRLWRWWSQFTLSELAIFGPHPEHMAENKYACVLPELILTESDVCEVISCTDEAAEKIQAIKNANED